jgi:hypothetical protein
VAATAESLGLTTVLTTLAVAAGFLALHYLTGAGWWETAGGWILLVLGLPTFGMALAITVVSDRRAAYSPLMPEGERRIRL